MRDVTDALSARIREIYDATPGGGGASYVGIGSGMGAPRLANQLRGGIDGLRASISATDAVLRAAARMIDPAAPGDFTRFGEALGVTAAEAAQVYAMLAAAAPLLTDSRVTDLLANLA